MLDQQKAAFREEAYELLAELEESLLEMELRPTDQEVIGKVFRAMHTIKGSGAMFGFEEVAAFTHEVETVYDLVRSGRLSVTTELINLSLAARDQIKAMLGDATDPEGADPEKTADLAAAFRKLLPVKAAVAAATGVPASPTPTAPADAATYRIRFRPDVEIFLRGTNPLGLLNELRELGPCQVFADVDGIPSLEEFNAEHCYLGWEVILTTAAPAEDIHDVFIFVENDCELAIELIDAGQAAAEEAPEKRLGEILVERGDLRPEALATALGSRKRLGEMLIETRQVSPAQIEAALAEQRQLQERRKEQAGQEGSSVRVPAARLDGLVDLVGELVTIQSRLSQTAVGSGNPELLAIAEEVERLTVEMRDNILNIRMLPIGTTFSKFKRLVRDLSQELGKEVELKTSGAETELDKTVLEKLNDPLVHLIRNSLDHGIEPPTARMASGKPPQGTVQLSAQHSGDSVIIEISDDGNGLDPAAIRRKAVEKGLLGDKDDPSEQELYQLLFAPGFSTAKQVTSVSGRGVGMDVVKRAIEALRGSIEIRSRRGEGTTMRVKIPLTLAIIESLLVRIGSASYVLPLAQVEECIELTREDEQSARGGQLANVRGQLVPYISLRQRFAVAGEPPPIQQIVITQINRSRVGFVVDRVIGEHQTVIKSLGRLYRDVQGLSGATILGNGSLALILDVQQLIQDTLRDQDAPLSQLAVA